MYSFSFNVGGFKVVINVIGDDIGKASIKAFGRCAENVGENFKRKAMNGDYLRSVEVTHDVVD